jgi:membrane protease YdiL (CAAX protease family)
MKYRALVTYLLLTTLFTSFFDWRIIRYGLDPRYLWGMTWSCAAAALVTCLLTGRSLGSLGWRWPGLKYMALSYLIPVLYATATYFLIWALQLGSLSDRAATLVRALPYLATFFLVNSFLYTLGEEIGWRGFLVPELARSLGFTATALVSGAIWAIWHYPIIIFGDYHGFAPRWYSVLCFTVMVLGISFPFSWMRLKTGSLWTGAMLHGSHNLFIQMFFDRITGDTGPTRYMIGEFGAGLAIVSLLVAGYFWSRRGEVEQQPSTHSPTTFSATA